MSDLACPATVVLARHGEAEYESASAMAAPGGSLTALGRRQAAQLAASLAPRRVAMIYCSSMVRAVQTAEISAAVLGLPVRVRHDLREFGIGDLEGQPFDAALFEPVMTTWRGGDLSIGCPGGETGADVVRRVTGVLEEIADQHRGETVLVASHSGAIQLAVTALAPGVSHRWTPEHPLGYCDTVELEVDADGWRCPVRAG